jgi:uroporphyrinogen decarboxylase
MKSRERILTAIAGGEPDHVPCALSFYHLDLKKLAPSDCDIDSLVDIRFVSFPISPEESRLSHMAKPYSGDTRLGTLSQMNTYTRWNYIPADNVRRNPLFFAKSIDDLRAFPFPEFNAPYTPTGLAKQVEDYHARGLAVGGNLPHLGGELFEAAWRLRGLENFLLDLLNQPDWAHYLLDRLTELACRNAESLAKAGVDVLALDDDIGMPGTMIISPALWRTFFKPRLASIISEARAVKSDLRVLYHSDGYIEPIIADLIEIGVDALNPVQPDHMDAIRIRKHYGKRIALWGTVGTQTAFSFNTPRQINQEVKVRLTTLGRKGLILCPAYDIDEPDIPWENVAAFLEAVHEIG